VSGPAPLASAIAAAAQSALAGAKTWGIGTVTAAAAGPPATVTITLRGQSLPGVHYLTSYTPTITDKVLVLTGGQQVVVLGKITA
jgi:hypothetical protein